MQGPFNYCQQIRRDSVTYVVLYVLIMNVAHAASIPFTTYLSKYVALACVHAKVTNALALHKYVNITGIFQTFQNDRAFLHLL